MGGWEREERQKGGAQEEAGKTAAPPLAAGQEMEGSAWWAGTEAQGHSRNHMTPAGAAKPQRPQELSSTLCIPDAGFSSLLLLRLNFGLEALDLPAQVGDDVRVLRDAVGHVQQIALHLVGGTHGQGQSSWELPAVRCVQATRTPAHFVRKIQIDTTQP